MKAYKNVYYDKWNKQICVRYVGDTEYTKIDYTKDYWVLDKSGKSDVTDLHGNKMVKKKLTDKEVVKSLKANGVAVAESDFREEVKWMHDVYDTEELIANVDDWNIGFFDIETATGVGDGFPKPEEARFPINLITFYSTKTKEYHTWGLNLDIHEDEIVQHYHGFTNELDMMKDWLKWFSKQHFDVITGWNTILFDVPYIINRIKNLRNAAGIETEYERLLSPLGKRPEIKDIADKKQRNELGSSYEIPGLIHHDYMELYKTFAKHDPLPSYSLQYVSMLVLGKGKLEYEGTINTIWQTDPQQFGRYNVVDVSNIVEMEHKYLRIFPTIIEYAYDCIVNLDKVFNKVPTTEGYFLRYLHSKNKVMNDRVDHHEDWWRREQCYIVKKDGKDYYQNCEWENDKYDFEDFHVKAGYCYDYPGRYDNCMSFDITSSYPHHIMQFNISPEVKVIHPTKEQIKSGEVIPSDVAEVGFRRTDDAILPTIVKKVFDERKHFKQLMKEAEAAGDKVLANLYDTKQGIKKIIINSMYGVCLAPTFHLYDIDCARSITRCARVTLRDWLAKYANEYYVSQSFISAIESEFGIKLKDHTPIIIKNRDAMQVHSDTDSVYLCFDEAVKKLQASGIKFNTEEEKRDVYSHIENVMQKFFNKILDIRAEQSNTTNRIKFNRENIFKDMFCFAKKLYIGDVIDSEGHLYPFDKPKHKIMGVGIKRSDMPDFCKEAAEKLAFDIAAGQDYDTSYKFIKDVFTQFQEAGPDAVSAKKSISEYTKYVTKPIEDYVKNGLHFDKGQVFNAKCSLAYNYVIAKHKLPYTPIFNGNKFNYVYVKPTNRYNIEAIAFVGKWPKEFDDIFEVDYETMFTKTFIPLFESMFKVAKWIGEKDNIILESSSLDSFFM